MGNWLSTTDLREATLGWLTSYWKEVLITAVVIVIALMFAPRLHPSTSHVTAQAAKPSSQESRSPDIWPFSLHVKCLPE